VTLTKTQVPYTGPYSVRGNGHHRGPTALALKRAMSRLGHLPWEPDKWDNVFNRKLEDALDKWTPGHDGYGPGRYDKLRAAKTSRGEYALDAQAIALIKSDHQESQAKVPDLGPIFNGGASVLQHDLTHPTGGIPLYPAFDDAFRQGTGIIAPEEMTCTRISTSNPGLSMYATGKSGIKWWFGHLDSRPPVGTKLRKGQKIGNVAANNVGGGPLCHVGMNVEALWGAGKEMSHKENYTHGAPLVGDQLRAGKPL
jgi:hypothetical protein